MTQIIWKLKRKTTNEKFLINFQKIHMPIISEHFHHDLFLSKNLILALDIQGQILVAPVTISKFPLCYWWQSKEKKELKTQAVAQAGYDALTKNVVSCHGCISTTPLKHKSTEKSNTWQTDYCKMKQCTWM